METVKTFLKVCRLKKCSASFKTTVRKQAYCCTEHQKEDALRKKKRKRVYNADKVYFRLKARSHAIASELMELWGVDKVCVECEAADKPLQPHHKDVDWGNNSRSNLEYRCVPCHIKKHTEIEAAKKVKEPAIDASGSCEGIPIEDNDTGC